jgi:hypothetical protein
MSVYDKYILTEKREDLLWDKAIFVFDTSALLNFYDFNDEAKNALCKILEILKERIWIPAQVFCEYQKGREKVINKPITDSNKYGSTSFKPSNTINDFKEFIEKNKNNEHHPYFDNEELNRLQELFMNMEPLLNKAQKLIDCQYAKRKNEILELLEIDIIKNEIEKLYIGDELSSEEMLSLVKEGEVRYRNSIPPGYKDKKNKVGTQIYGDLIIWMQILKFAQVKEKNIIFICDDVKQDWYEEAQRKMLQPRHELLHEFYSYTKNDIWFYPFEKFLYHFKQKCETKSLIAYIPTLERIVSYLQTQTRTKYLLQHFHNQIALKCHRCGEEFEALTEDFCFEWIDEYEGEGRMGAMYYHSATEIVTCPKCQQDIFLNLNIWEYPQGIYTNQVITSDDADILGEIDLRYFVKSGDYKCCVRCGRRAMLDEEGLCEYCADELDYEINKE